MILDDVVHECPPTGSGMTACCGRPPGELKSDRMTSDAGQVTCPGRRVPLPLDLFTRPDGEPMPAGEAIGMALGAASMCWEDVSAAGVFDSSRCGEIFDRLTAHLASLNAPAEPLLGLATTREMLNEVEVRAAIGRLDPRLAEFREAFRMLESAARMLRVAMPKLLLDYRAVGEG